MGTSQRTTLLRYGGAVAIILFATIVRFWLETPLAGGGFMVFFVAVIIASWFGGLGPSLVALVLSVVLSAWFFPHPQGAPREPLARGLAGLGIFFFSRRQIRPQTRRPPTMLPIVFELFMQAAPPDGIKGGLGIGLTLVKSLVELMGGSVEARSEGLGKGSEFVIRLPRPRQDDASLAAPQTVSPAGSPIESRRIFVVDDNADAAETLSAMLRLDGHDVTMFQTARSALDAAETIAPEVVLLDLGMPEMDGIELARQLRSLPATADATLIAVTGWGQPADRERTRLAGIDHHLVKPIDAAVLRELLMQCPVRKEDGPPRPSPSMVTG